LLARHLILRVVSASLVILAVVTAALMATQLVRLGPLFLGPWVRLQDASIAAAVLPFLTLALPASLALAMGVVSASMTRRGERASLASSGVPASRVAAGPALLCLAGTALTALLSLSAGPWAFGVLERTLGSLATRAVFHSLPEGRFVDLPDGSVLFARAKSLAGDRTVLDHVILSRDDGAGTWLTVSARQALIIHRGEGRCTFVFGGALLQADGWQDGRMEADVEELFLPVDLGAVIAARRDELPAVLGASTWAMDPSGPPLVRYHLHRRWSVVTAALLLLLCAASTFLPPRLARPWSAPALVAVALVAYHALVRAFEEAATKGLLAPELSAWLPAAALVAACAFAAFRSRPVG